MYSLPKDISVSIKNAKFTIQNVSNLLMGQEVLEEVPRFLEEDESIETAQKCVKLYPKVFAKISQKQELRQGLLKELGAISNDLAETFEQEDQDEAEEFFEVNLTDLSEKRIAQVYEILLRVSGK